MSLALAARLMLKDFADANKVTLGDVTKLIAAQRELEAAARFVVASPTWAASGRHQLRDCLAALDAIRNPKDTGATR